MSLNFKILNVFFLKKLLRKNNYLNSTKIQKLEQFMILIFLRFIIL